MATTFTSWDPAEFIDDAEDAALDLTYAAACHDPSFFISALGDVARAYSMGRVADAAGVSRESLYRSFSAEGNPRFATVMNALTAMGLELQVVVAKPHPELELDAVLPDDDEDEAAGDTNDEASTDGDDRLAAEG